MVDEYLKISEVAQRLKLEPRTIRNKMALGGFRRGVHYFSPPGLAPRFKWSAVVFYADELDLLKGKTSDQLRSIYRTKLTFGGGRVRQ